MPPPAFAPPTPTPIPVVPAARLPWSAGAIMVGGAALYLALLLDAFGTLPGNGYGAFLYNRYFLALLDGHFDVPVRVAAFEGHYDAAGRAYIYHGLAPLLTRALAFPFVDLTRVSLVVPTIWLFTVLGTALYHRLLVRLVRTHGPQGRAGRATLTTLAGLLVWLAGPGLLLAASDSFYHEPIAIAFCLTAGVIVLACRALLFRAPIPAIIVPLALCAGAAVHARPQVAIGLYVVAVGLMALHHARHGWRPGAGRSVAALLVLFAFGAALLAVNWARFGDPLLLHGSWDPAAPLQYAPVYWHLEPADAPRVRTFLTHGQFELWRIGPNLVTYLADFPAYAARLEAMYAALAEWTGHVRLEPRRMGLLFLGAAWLPVLGLALARGSRPGPGGWVLLLGCAVPALFILAYPTVTVRYRVELWPPFIAFIALAAPGLLNWLGTARRGQRLGLGLAVGLGLAASGLFGSATVYGYGGYFQAGGVFSQWDRPFCLELARAKGFAAAEADRLCREPVMNAPADGSSRQ
ncbi:hypothetical protein [Roseospirillum parvum]|uniref:4-amino-4-deoxy-L-arabinose transferase n=1 Tax=Roseospirillum parvum TaxID=83401 RepID=A0A1G8CZ92_9PROT|nr:hypothetical protein [Roseospirillum parvum]SDH50816.1 hypothetical protein SAMN05421742_107139 [Roseospirillum parvum]